MMETEITNNHLKEVIKDITEFLEKEEEPPFEILYKLICELKVSNLLLPAFEDGDTLNYQSIEMEETEDTFLPLFTDIEEFNKHDIADGYNPMPLDFEDYVEMVLEDDDCDGIFINPEGNFLPLERDFLTDLDFDVNAPEEAEEPYTAEELKGIFDSVSNESLVEFIRSENNSDFEKLFVELSDSTLINPLIYDSSLDDKAEDGIINIGDGEGFGICAVEDPNGISLVTIFTDINAMNDMDLNEDVSYCGQITVLSALFDYVLKNDMDGVIINQNTDDYIIPRDALLQQAGGVELIADESKFINAVDYAFLM